ncbi:MAG: filamentous hemagglutinin N-terminal domain-containing protein, partial [Cyanobacteria bacterium J083]
MAGEWNLFQYQLQTVLVGVIVAGGLSAGVAEAQLTPDNSLGSESSVVNPIDTLIDLIEGGATRGSNLFHSFQEFNVDFGRAVYFNPNNAAILNILTRVTGANPSNINGVLGVLGNANLFLINPNGIIFGAGASLDLNGSFIGSTADSILFDNFEFSASNPQAVPLTVNIPIGLGFRDNPGDITVNSVVSDVTFGFNLNANVVNNSQNIALIGGNVDISGFFLGDISFPVDIRFPGANITIGGVAEAGEVSFNETLNFNFPNNVEQGNVSINNASILTGVTQDANFKQSGNINILGKQIAINNSNVSTGILTGTELLSGDITIG